MSVDYKDLFEYRDGNLYWKTKTHPSVRIEVGDKAGGLDEDGYTIVCVNYKSYKAHRVIWEMFNGKIPKGKVVDHINNKKSDNRIENLQCITQAENSQRGNYKHIYSLNKNNKYASRKQYNNKRHHLGNYGTPCGAYMASKMFFIGGRHV